MKCKPRTYCAHWGTIPELPIYETGTLPIELYARAACSKPSYVQLLREETLLLAGNDEVIERYLSAATVDVEVSLTIFHDATDDIRPLQCEYDHRCRSI